MGIENLMTGAGMYDAMAGGIFGAIVAIGVMFALVILAAIYIYFALAWTKIAKREKYKNPWMAWIPLLNLAMILQLGGLHWAWIFTAIFPPALLVLIIIASWRIFEKNNYPGWFSISLVIPKVGWILYLVVIGFVAWGKKPKSSSRTSVRVKSISKKKAKKK